KLNLRIIPCVNKIDLPFSRADEVAKETGELLGISPDSILRISAKVGTGVKELLDTVISEIPPPSGSESSPLQALIFDSRYDAFKGVVAYVRVVEGSVKSSEKVWFAQSGASSSLKEVGYFLPQEMPALGLLAGEIGYVATGMKSSELVRIGDTLTVSSVTPALPGYKEPQPLVFVSLYPENPDEFDILKDAIAKLKLNDPSFTAEPESREALGRGFRCGFLGVLHSEIIAERIRREYNLSLVVSRPSVEFKVRDKQGREIPVRTAGEWPDPGLIEETLEPYSRLRVLAPSSQYAQALSTVESIEGERISISYIGSSTVLFEYEVPLRELIIDFYDTLKSATQGLASMDYEIVGFRTGDLVKLDILVAGEREEALAFIVPRAKAEAEGRRIVEKLKKSLPSQLFAVSLQAAISGKVLARETMSAKRRDVIAPLY
ncbi:MAG: elongation factor 4, partial [Candidatus Pacearchaeota archaeon]|nr:elongation factor 4 [Candidatus Pacearchaeota archaeon]